MKPGYDGSPLTLAAPAVTLAQGGSATIDAGALTNPYRRPLLIDSINFLVKALAATSGAGGAASPNSPVNLGMSVRVRFTMGRLGLSFQFVPIALHGPQPSPVDTLGTLAGSPVTGYSFTGNDQASVQTAYNTFRWRLPRPLLVPPGETLIPQVSRADTTIANTAFSNGISFAISYSARIPNENFRMPKSIDVPYLATFVSGEALSYARSADTDLLNATNEVVHVQRLMGAIQIRPVAAAGQMQYNNGVFLVNTLDDDLTSSLPINTLFNYETGYRINQDYLPFFVVFNPARLSCDVAFDMEPGARLAVQFKDIPTTFEGDIVPLYGTLNPTIGVSLIGWRTVPIP